MAFIVDTMTTLGGMERVTATVASGLAGRGYEVQIVTLRGEGSVYALHPGVEVTALGLPTGHLNVKNMAVPFARALRAQFRRSRPDVLVTVDTYLSVYAFPAAAGLGIRRVAWEHFNFDFDFGMQTRRFGRRLAAYGGHEVVTLTGGDVARWRAAFPRARARVRAITNPLSFARRAENPYDPGHRTVLGVGWLEPRKGFDLLLRAWAEVEETCPEWRLKVVGTGPEEARLRALAAELGLTRWALGAQTDQIEPEYLAAGAYCLSSRAEGLPMVLIESQSCGVPAVAFDCPTGPAELLAPGGGLLVPPEHPRELAAALRRVLGSEDLRRDLSARAHAASARFDPEAVLDAWTQVLGAPVGGRRNLRPPARSTPTSAR